MKYENESLNNLSSAVNHDCTDDSNNHFIRIEPNCKKFKRRNYSIYSNTL